MNKRQILVGVSAAALLIALIRPAEAVIPVFDGSAVAELVAQIGEAEKSFALQINQYVTEVKEYFGDEWSWLTQASQFATELSHYYNDALMLVNFAHHPTLGAAMGLLNMAGLNSGLPVNPYAAMNLVNGSAYGQGGFSAIGGILSSLGSLANQSWNANRIYTPTDASWTSQQLIASSNSIAGSQGAAMTAYGDYRNHLGVLPTLRQNAASAGNTKDALDTANQLQAEIAWNVNEMGQAQSLATISALQQHARAQRDEERLDCELEMFRSGGGACPTGANGTIVGGGGSANGGSDTMPVPPVPPLPTTSGDALSTQADPPLPVPPQPVPPPPDYVPPSPPPGTTTQPSS